MAHKSFIELSQAASPLIESKEIPSVFFKDVSFEKLQELSNQAKEASEEGELSHLLFFFEHMIVDADGDKFEDMQIESGINKVGVFRLRGLLAEITDLMGPVGNE